MSEDSKTEEPCLLSAAPSDLTANRADEEVKRSDEEVRRKRRGWEITYGGVRGMMGHKGGRSEEMEEWRWN